VSRVRLAFCERTEADPVRGRVPMLRYDIVADGDRVGEIVLRLGKTDHLRRYGGQLGYRVRPDAQRRGHATAAVRLLRPIAVAQGFDALWVTCRPDNVASRRVLEKAGAVFVEAVTVPGDSDLFARGDRVMCRYRLALP
jgi:tagatose 1,6-diphosphate aldolase